MIFQEKCLSCYTLLIYQISLSDWLYFSRYWEILSFWSSHFDTWPKRQDKNFWGKIKSIFQGLAVAKNCLRPVCTFKAGSNTELSNSRPTSVQPGFSKIHEHLMYNCLWKYSIQTFYKNSLPSRKGTKPTMQFYNL